MYLDGFLILKVVKDYRLYYIVLYLTLKFFPQSSFHMMIGPLDTFTQLFRWNPFIMSRQC